MELALEVNFLMIFHWVTRPWQRTLTNGSDVKYVFPLTNGSDVKYVFRGVQDGSQFNTLRTRFYTGNSYLRIEEALNGRQRHICLGLNLRQLRLGLPAHFLDSWFIRVFELHHIIVCQNNDKNKNIKKKKNKNERTNKQINEEEELSEARKKLPRKSREGNEMTLGSVHSVPSISRQKCALQEYERWVT